MSLRKPLLLVSPLSYLVGTKPDGDLSYIKQKAVRSMHVIAIDPQLKQQALSNLTLQLYQLHPVTTLIKKADGTYHYQSIMQPTQISSQPIYHFERRQRLHLANPSNRGFSYHPCRSK